MYYWKFFRDQNKSNLALATMVGISNAISVGIVSACRGRFSILSAMMSAITQSLFYSGGFPTKRNIDHIGVFLVVSPFLGMLSYIPHLLWYFLTTAWVPTEAQAYTQDYAINFAIAIPLTVGLMQALDYAIHDYLQVAARDRKDQDFTRLVNEIATLYDECYSKYKVNPEDRNHNHPSTIEINEYWVKIYAAKEKIVELMAESTYPLRIKYKEKILTVESYFLKEKDILKKFIYSENILSFIIKKLEDCKSSCEFGIRHDYLP